MKIYVLPDAARAVRENVFVQPHERQMIEVDVESTSEEYMRLISAALDPSGSGRLFEIVPTDMGPQRDPNVPLRAWPLTPNGVVGALVSCYLRRGAYQPQ